MRQFLTSLFPVTWSRPNSCQTCLLNCLLITSHASSSVERFSRDCPLTFELIYSGMIFLILYPWPWKLTKSIRAEFPLRLFILSPAPRRILLTPLDPQLPTGPTVQLLLTPAAARITGRYLLPCVITIVPGVPRPRNVELRVPGRETSSPAGGCLPGPLPHLL